jgi:hypothetical protein
MLSPTNGVVFKREKKFPLFLIKLLTNFQKCAIIKTERKREEEKNDKH